MQASFYLAVYLAVVPQNKQSIQDALVCLQVREEKQISK